ncbi:hypothetical protein Syun_022027 [Stephania yunnanensis]|uniref:Uncharacterized protein n=1 Tax=Stephania yunnanensis TaxID=152371 RepID=A0AAP0IHH2_9MAGN
MVDAEHLPELSHAKLGLAIGMMFLGGKERTREEWEQVIYRAGFNRYQPIKQLRMDIKEMQRSLLRVINVKTLDRDQLQEMQGRLGRMEQALMDKLGISFAPPSHPTDDSESDRDLDD